MKDTAEALLSAFREKKLSVKEYAEQVIERVAQHRDLGAILKFDEEKLVEVAVSADSRWRSGTARCLEGLMLGVKDNIDTIDLETTGGTSCLNSPAPENAPSLQSLLNNGALVAAKTNLHELAYGITSNNYSTGAVHNPWKNGYIAGGSSGGTAAAVAAGIFPAGLGTDTGGSVRIPAALCGIAGFRPTIGRYPAGGIAPISMTRDTVGAMAHTVYDITLLDSVMANEKPSFRILPAKSFRIAVPRTFLWEDLDPGVSEGCEQVLESMLAAGVTLIEDDLEDVFTDCADASLPIALYETMKELPDYANFRGISFESLLEGVRSPDVRGIIESQLGEDKVTQEVYRNAIDVIRPRMQTQWEDYFRKHRLDAVIFPTTPITARPIGQDETILVNAEERLTFPTFARNTEPGSVMGIPGISLPVGLIDGLPYGVELEGLAGQDRSLLEVAASMEEVFAPIAERKFAIQSSP